MVDFSFRTLSAMIKLCDECLVGSQHWTKTTVYHVTGSFSYDLDVIYKIQNKFFNL